MRVAHFIRRIPMLLVAVFCGSIGSIVGAICNSKILLISGKKRKTSFVVVKQRLIRSSTTPLEYALDLKFSYCSDADEPDAELWCARLAEVEDPNIKTENARFCTISRTMLSIESPPWNLARKSSTTSEVSSGVNDTPCLVLLKMSLLFWTGMASLHSSTNRSRMIVKSCFRVAWIVLLTARLFVSII